MTASPACPSTPIRPPSSRGAAHQPRFGVGSSFDTTFEKNPGGRGGFRLRSSTAGGARSDKVVLTSDRRVPIERPCTVRVVKVRRPMVAGRGCYEVEYVGEPAFELPPDVWVEPASLKRINRKLQIGEHILLLGPNGCGKGVIARAIAEGLGARFYLLNCSKVHDGAEYMARLELASTEDGASQVVYWTQELAAAISDAKANPEQLHVVFLDEFNRNPERARNSLMPVLDSSRETFDPRTGQAVGVPSNVRIIAACNPGSTFVGTTDIDKATFDRFCPVTLDYPPVDAEINIVKSHDPDADPRVVREAVELARRIRDDARIAGGVSVRAVIDAVQDLSDPAIAAGGPEARVYTYREAYAGNPDWFDQQLDDEHGDRGMVMAHVRRMVKGAE